MSRDKESRLISGCANWDEFVSAVCALPTTAQQGAAFERLTQFYLQTQPEYQSGLDAVWMLADVPADVLKQLRLTRVDEGIDLIAKTRAGDFWAVQCKFRADKAHRLTRRELATFTSLAFHTCQGFSLAIVAHTCAKPVKKHDLLPNTVEIGLERWLALTGDDWQRIQLLTVGKTVRMLPREPRPHQQKAIREARKHFVDRGASRGRLIMPCGTGKSLTAFWIARALGAGTILVAVPSLALIRQSLADWTREYLAAGVVPEWLVVCSDESTGNLERDEFVGATYDLGIPTTTDATEIADFLRRLTDNPKIVFATYQSGGRLAQGAKGANFVFDLGIFDEAHKTVGAKSKAFAALLFDKNVPIRQRVFMTATERVLSGRNDDVLSMSDTDTYGERFYSLSFKHAINESLISDYRILTVTVSDERIRELVEDRRLVDLGDGDLDAIDATTVAAGVALKRTIAEYGVKHAISFHRSIGRAVEFSRQQDVLNSVQSLGAPVENLHISSKKSAGERAELLRNFANSELALITNARCLTEGVDVPAIDCVLFADPKQSTVDIVQAAGRALRRFEGKEYGYILLPLVVPSEMSFDEFAETTEFRQVAKVITALSIQDERIAEEFRAIDRSKRPSGKLVQVEGDVPIGATIRPDEFAEKVFARVWERVGRANWRIFVEARTFIRTLGLGSVAQWRQFSKSEELPSDIPANPDTVYGGEGWISWGDWLGTGAIAPQLRQFRDFELARHYARSLALNSAAQWNSFAKSEKRPADVPTNPQVIYRNDGWDGWGDWLGTGTIASRDREYLPFREAREFVRALGLRSSAAWKKYAASDGLPANIPRKPDWVYRNDGWNGHGDWIGTGTQATHLRTYRPFPEARSFARSLGLSSGSEWRKYVKVNGIPTDIPHKPDHVYADQGWSGMGDWLGTGNLPPRGRKYRRFEDARRYVRSLGLKNAKEWFAFTKSSLRPTDIPSMPHTVYKEAGWQGMKDWLGTGD